MVKCVQCGRDLSSAKGCGVHTVRVGGKVFNGVRMGDPGDFYEGESKATRCHDCNALYAHCHHWGCDAERCPVCGRQLISCECRDVTIGSEDQPQKTGASTRAVCYARVAHPDQLALDKQLTLNRTFAKEQGYDIVAIIAEWGTGNGMNRPGLQKLLEHVRHNDFDVLTINGLNRLGRNLSIVLPLLRSLRKQGIRVESPMKGAGYDLLDSLPILRDLDEKGGGADGLV